MKLSEQLRELCVFYDTEETHITHDYLMAAANEIDRLQEVEAAAMSWKEAFLHKPDVTNVVSLRSAVVALEDAHRVLLRSLATSGDQP